MKYLCSLSLCAALLMNACTTETSQPGTSQPSKGFEIKNLEIAPLSYPETNKGEVIDEIHGEKIADPYRWLEDDYSDETKAWVTKQNEVTFGLLDQIPYRQQVRDRLDDIYNYTKYTAPSKVGDHYYYFKNDGLQNQSIMYRTSDASQEGDVFLDPNKFSDDGTVALASLSMKPDNKLMGYSISRAGSDWQEIYVMNVEDQSMLSDSIKWAKFTQIAWHDDGFYYGAFPAPDEKTAYSETNQGMRIYYHKLGTPQSEDRLIYEDPKQPNRFFSASTTRDGQYLLITSGMGTSGNDLRFKRLDQPGSDFAPIVDDFESDFEFVGHDGEHLYFMTNREADNWRLLRLHRDRPSQWEDIIPNHEKRVLSGASLVGDHIYVTYREDVKNTVYKYDLDGKNESQIQLPGIGSVGGFSGRREDQEIFFNFTSMTQPGTIYSYDVTSGEIKLFRQPELPIDVTEYTTEQVFYTSKDGTKVPMYIVYKKGLQRDGNNPTWLYGYGGFNISLMPTFSSLRLAWLEQGGIFALANLRGGGEYGQQWHDGGRLLNKQNVFDDFITAAEYLIEQKYTSSDKLAINGGSNGGLLVGACMTQRPDLFAVAIPEVGVLDMLRYEKFTIGYLWASDYGSVEDVEHFKNLYGYSPLHQLKPGTHYPATLVMTGDHDDRVVPAHSFKYAAALQEAHGGEAPVLIRVAVDAGHGAGKPTPKILDEYADKLVFMMHNMGVSPRY